MVVKSYKTSKEKSSDITYKSLTIPLKTLREILNGKKDMSAKN